MSHIAPTLNNPNSSRGHTVYIVSVDIEGLESVSFVCCDLAGSEGHGAVGTKEEFIEGLQNAMLMDNTLNVTNSLNPSNSLSVQSLPILQHQQHSQWDAQQRRGFETMYKLRFLEAGCINHGLTQLQSIFRELMIGKKLSKSRGIGLRKLLIPFISLKSAYAILFTLSPSGDSDKMAKATMHFAKCAQLAKVRDDAIVVT